MQNWLNIHVNMLSFLNRGFLLSGDFFVFSSLHSEFINTTNKCIYNLLIKNPFHSVSLFFF